MPAARGGTGNAGPISARFGCCSQVAHFGIIDCDARHQCWSKSIPPSYKVRSAPGAGVRIGVGVIGCPLGLLIDGVHSRLSKW